MFWTSLIIWAVGTLFMELVRPKPAFENARPAGMGEFNFPTATQGRPIPIIWGRVRIAGPNVVWYGDKRDEALTEHVTTGLFSGEDVVIGYRYYIGMVFALCRGPDVRLRALFINDHRVSVSSGSSEVPDAGYSFTMTIYRALGFQAWEDRNVPGGPCRFYGGSPTQDLNTYYAAKATDPVPFRGTACLVWEGGAISPSTNIAPWEFVVERIPDGLNLASAVPGAEEPCSYCAALPNVLYEILTDSEWGLGIDSGAIDITNFREAAATLYAEGNGFAMILDNVMPVEDLIREVERQMDGSLYYDRVDALWKIKLVRDDYDPGTLPVFDESNILDFEEFTRQTWEETVNQVRVSYLDNYFSYFQRTYAMAQDIANINMQGYVISTELNYPGVTNADLANSLAWRDLRVLSYPLAKISLNVNRDGFGLAPGDVFKLNWERLGIDGVVFRVQKINTGTLGSPEITIFAIEDIFSTGVGSFTAPGGTSWDEDTANAPVAVTSANTLVLEAPRQMVAKDPFDSSQNPRAWAGARSPGGGTTAFRLWSRTGSGSWAGLGDYGDDTSISSFLLAGKLDSAIPAYGASAVRPETSYSIDVDSDPDDLASLIINGDENLVNSLQTIAYVDGEYIGFEKLEDAGGGIYTLIRIYRGLFNTVPTAHSAGERVWFIGQTGGNLATATFAPGDDRIELQLRSRSNIEELEEGDCVDEQLLVDNIWKDPLPPRDPVLNGTYADSTLVSADASYPTGTGRTLEDARAIQVQVSARAWRIDTVTQDHQLALSSPSYLSDSPEIDFDLVLDPSGTPAAVATLTAADPETPVVYIERNDMIVALGANVIMPTTAELTVTPKHTPPEFGTEITGTPLVWDMTITSALTSADFSHGGFLVNVLSPAVIYPESGTFTFDINPGGSTALPSSGILVANVNSGGWVTVISAGATTGTLAITSGDSVELLFTQIPSNGDQFFDVTGSTTYGYGVLRG